MIFTYHIPKGFIWVFNTGFSKAVELSSFVLLPVLMSLSVPLSWECAVYFFKKNVHFILGSIKVAEWPHSANTRSCSLD